MITLTYDMLHKAGTTGYSGWNSHQLALLGVGKKPKRGWLKRLVGRKISESTWNEVIELRGMKPSQRKLRYSMPKVKKFSPDFQI